jgi:hypothetical protein
LKRRREERRAKKGREKREEGNTNEGREKREDVKY